MTQSERWWNSWTAQVIGILIVDVIVIAAFWIGEALNPPRRPRRSCSPRRVLVFGRGRSQTAEVISGVGDERTRDLYQRSASVTCGVMSVVIVGWFLGTVIDGDPNQTLSLLGFIFGVTLLVSAAFFGRRG